MEINNNRLNRNFHQTFKPERQHIRSILSYAATNKEGTIQEIAEETNIPMGKTSGKAPAIFDYSLGMGLTTLDKSNKVKGIKKLVLTSFGQIVIKEDPFLKTEITQWISHFYLCNKNTGADLWYKTFVENALAIGTTFQRDKLEHILQQSYGVNNDRAIIGPLIGTYEDDAALGKCAVLEQKGNLVYRIAAPIKEENIIGYGAWMIEEIIKITKQTEQIPISQLDEMIDLSSITGWSENELCTALKLIEEENIIKIDKHMNPWLITITTTPDDAWKKIYNKIL